MRNKKLLGLLKVLAVMSMLAFQPESHAVRITLTLPDCGNGQVLQYDAANASLACVGGGQVDTPNNCTITAVPNSTPAAPLNPGTQVQLTALCTGGNAPISYAWNIGVITNVVTVAPQSTTTYTVTPSNAAGGGSPFSATVYAGPVVGLPPSGCSISQSPNTLATPVAAGTNVTLSATCTGGNAVTSCSWNNGIGSTACSVSIAAPSVSTSYTVTANNAAGSAPPVSTLVQVSAGNVGNAGTNMCTGSDSIISVGWPASGQVRPATSGFGNQKIAFRITIPATFSPSLNINHLGFMHISEVPGGAVTSRDMTVSRSSCDFTGGADTIYNAIGFGDTAPGANYTVNNPNGYLSAGGNFNLQSGDVVYVNVRNSNNGAPSCPNSSCDILFDFATPNRY